MELDPIQYEIFRHRLFNILEEGRIAIKMVSGSPVAVEGGETMCAFYASDGTPILTAAGILLHAMGAWDFVRRCILWYEEDPGIHDGDQFFFNDPYIGGCHLPDYVVIKPIFYQGKRIAWTGSIMHTPDTGGLEPSGMMATSREIFHEGIRILGLKVVEGGRFRPDVFRSIVEQVRDPHLVGLDTKAKIAANNVCARAYLELVEHYGLDFVEAASQRIIADSDKMARARLRSLPDGTWRSRLYADSLGTGERPFKVVCTMTKEGEEVIFDYTGSSPQREGSMNSTLPGSWSCLFVALAGLLFWNVPWNGGMVAPVHLIAPEGSVVNCRFPAACSNGVVSAGVMLTATAHECIAKMLFAGGLYEDVNAAWRSVMDGRLAGYGGHNQLGRTVGGQILDNWADGCGATPLRDGVNSGGHLRNPQSSISDTEITEMNYPFLYLGRNHVTDIGGFGKYTGGMAPERLMMVYGSQDLTVCWWGVGAIRAPGGWGMFGGYPPGSQDTCMVLRSNIRDWFQDSCYPATFAELPLLEGELVHPKASFRARPVREYDILSNRMCAGSGYGDPLDRDPEAVLEGVRNQAVSLANADLIYGVVIHSQTLALDRQATERRRRDLKEERLRDGRRLGNG